MAHGKISVNSKLPTPLVDHKRWALYRLVDGKPQFFVPAKRGDFFFDVGHEPLSFTEDEKRLMNYASAIRKLKAASADGVAYLVGGSLDSDDRDTRLTAVITHSAADTEDIAALIERAIGQEPFAVKNVCDDGYTFFVPAWKLGDGGYYFSALEITDGRLNAHAEKERFIAFSSSFRNAHSPTRLNKHSDLTQLIFEQYDPSVLTKILQSLATDGSLGAFNYSAFIDYQTGDIIEGMESRFGEAINITKEVDAPEELSPPNSFTLPDGYDPQRRTMSGRDNSPGADGDTPEQHAPADIFIANIPNWLTHEPFILWRLSTNSDGKQTKLPLTVAGDRLHAADVTKPDHWLDFVDACDAFNRFADQLNGLGLVVHGENITAVDLDHCLDNGQPNQFAADIISRLNGSYVEVSQSGSGLHFIFFDQFNGGLTRNRNKYIEIYTDKRFIALTANTFLAAPADRYVLDGETLKLATDMFLSNDELQFNFIAPRGVSPEVDTNSLLEIIRRSKDADAFNQLFNGDISVKDDDWSRADFALCYKAAFWSNGNFDQIIDIWRQSKLAGRNKFDRADYPERTVNAALALWHKNGSPHYDPKSKSRSEGSVCVDPALYIEGAPEIDTSFDVDAIRKGLAVNRFGMPLARAINFDLIFDRDPNVKGIVAFNAFSQRIEIKRRPFWRNTLALTNAWQDSDDAALQNYLDRTYALTGESACRRTLDELAHKNAFHPVRDYFKALPPWDGRERAATLLIDNLGAPDNEYVRAVTKHWLLAAVARVFHPGCKFDFCLVLKGKQGIGKSTLLAKLGGAWFGELNSIQGKDAVGDLQGLWIVELVEMQATKRADNEQIKAFLSTNCDRARLSYDRRTSEFPRQCVFAATTNEHEFLRDQTGGRRFWIVELDATEYALQPALDIDLIWAEIFHVYKEQFVGGFDSAALDIPNELKGVATELQAKNTDGSDLRGRIAAFLDRPIPMGSFWQLLSQEERRQYFKRGTIALPLARIERDKDTEDMSSVLRKFVKQDIGGNDCVYINFDTEDDELRYLLFNRDPRRKLVSPVELANELFYDDKLAVSNRRIADILRTLDGWQASTRRRRDSAYGIQNTVFERLAELE